MLAAASSIANSSISVAISSGSESSADTSSSLALKTELEPEVASPLVEFNAPIAISSGSISSASSAIHAELTAEEIENSSRHPRNMSDAELYLRLISIMFLVLAPSIAVAAFVVFGTFSALNISLMSIACVASLVLAYYLKCRLEAMLAVHDIDMSSDSSIEPTRALSTHDQREAAALPRAALLESIPSSPAHPVEYDRRAEQVAYQCVEYGGRMIVVDMHHGSRSVALEQNSRARRGPQRSSCSVEGGSANPIDTFITMTGEEDHIPAKAETAARVCQNGAAEMLAEYEGERIES
jgi:hypothetical protein